MASMTNVLTDDAIRTRSYMIWEREGRPEGRDLDHWLRAAQELGMEARTEPVAVKAAPVAAKKAKTVRSGTSTTSRKRAPAARQS